MAERVFTLYTPLEDGLLNILSLRGDERISEVFEFALELVSESPDIASTDLIGKPMTVKILLQNGNYRYLDGITTKFSYIGPDTVTQKHHHYHIRLHSWLFLAGKVADSKIYQNQTIPEIIHDLLAPFNMPFELDLTLSYPKQEYEVQFNETILTFLMRLCEEAGIYYYVQHEMGKHTIVFCDGYNPTLPDYPEIVFAKFGADKTDDGEKIHQWCVENELKSGSFRARSYDFKNPKATLEENATHPREHTKDSLEIFEWDASYVDPGEGEKLAKVRLGQQQMDWETIVGVCDVRGMAPGYRFTLQQHPREAANIKYLILGAHYLFQENNMGDSPHSDATNWSITFTARSNVERYWPQRITSKARVTGPHSALITGPSGQEIWTDQYARVKVHFYWDRYSKKDENSSKWIRVSTSWAGSNFGAIAIPRIGQEVLIDYENGDINFPVVVGRVYNQSNMPPWKLPDNATQSGVLTRSSQHGDYSHANAIRFEDKKGAEQLWVQAERNMDTHVEANDSQTVGASRTINVGGIHSETVIGNIGVTSAEGSYTLQTLKAIEIGAVSEHILLQVGKSSLLMKADGTIVLKGVKILSDADDINQIQAKLVNINP